MDYVFQITAASISQIYIDDVKLHVIDAIHDAVLGLQPTVFQ